MRFMAFVSRIFPIHDATSAFVDALERGPEIASGLKTKPFFVSPTWPSAIGTATTAPTWPSAIGTGTTADEEDEKGTNSWKSMSKLLWKLW